MRRLNKEQKGAISIQLKEIVPYIKQYKLKSQVTQ